VTTKCDLLEGDAASDAREALLQFEGQIEKLLRGRFQITAFRTAARDPEGRIEPARGVAPLLRSWLTPPQMQVIEQPELMELSDEFDRFLLRRNVK